ncbi:MAG TPA: fused response regulator/phosphatase [Streptosporangiaceae bacterium]|jgi:DNA-binding response OmpR family regulator|nr:fused response regulator/phosphatase [Streptosporangiaceae bacterium]
MPERSSAVLVVDDSEAKRYLMASWLRRDGYRVIEAGTGQDALGQLAGVDLVVLDVRLPDLSGEDVCARIKSDPATAVIPVIQVSAIATDVSDRARGLQQGADAYLAEPIEPEEFLATITAALRSSQARRLAELAASRLTALNQATLAINAAETFDRLALAAAESVAKIFDAPSGLMMVLPEGQLRRYVVAPPESPRRMGGPIEMTETLAGRVLTGSLTATANIPREEWRRLAPDTALPGDACVAVSRAKPTRPAVVFAVAAEAVTSPEAWHILHQLAQSTAQAVEALRAYADEHLVALTLQRSLLPASLPVVPGVEMCARYVPASDQAEVGGDFYEVLARDGHLLAAIGDVQGHSLHAATVMGELRHALRAFADEGHPLPAIASLLNSVLRRYHPDVVATLCLIRLDQETGELQIVNCGHIPPLLIGPDGVEYRGQGGMLLGTPIDDPHAEQAFLPPGGTILLFTDGLVEERTVVLDENLERLRLAAQATSDPTLDTFADRILALFGAREDDVALLALRREPQAPS